MDTLASHVSRSKYSCRPNISKSIPFCKRTGVTVHNLRALKWNQTTPEQWAIEFDDWIIKHMQAADKDALFNWEKNAPHAQLAVPRAEHFVPLFIAMGSGENSG